MAVCLDYQAVYCPPEPMVGRYGLNLTAALILLAALCFRVWIKVESTEWGYDMARERQRTVALDMERRDLDLQISILTRPDNLSRRAREQLGLRPLNPQQARKIVLP